nr:immunoglobulin heavy chain junction region [Mus musculus]
CARGVLFFAYW